MKLYMVGTFRITALALGMLAAVVTTLAQEAVTIPTSINAAPVIDAAGPEQRKSLSSIFLIVCPGVDAGTGFALESGLVVTNAHVVGTCSELSLVGMSSSSQTITFSQIIKDSDRDLALLVPREKMLGGFKLAARDNPEPGTTVSTWGYPFLYNGVSPLLSVGYVAGYRDYSPGQNTGKTPNTEADGTPTSKTVKHIIVNGAFNHGNSGGPLLVSHASEVIGIVVLTHTFYPTEVQDAIDYLQTQKSGLQLTRTRPGGQPENISESQLTASILNEFYQKTQVMIGEAISASELRAFIHEKNSELPPPMRLSSPASQKQNHGSANGGISR
jgi:S1-C subfamily serine protease